MNGWRKQAVGVVLILGGLILFIFTYPGLHDSLGRLATLGLWIVVIALCEMLWSRCVDK